MIPYNTLNAITIIIIICRENISSRHSFTLMRVHCTLTHASRHQPVSCFNWKVIEVGVHLLFFLLLYVCKQGELVAICASNIFAYSFSFQAIKLHLIPYVCNEEAPYANNLLLVIYCIVVASTINFVFSFLAHFTYSRIHISQFDYCCSNTKTNLRDIDIER